MAKQKTNASDIKRRSLLQGALSATGILPLCCMTPRLPAGSVVFEPGTVTVDLTRVPELRRTGAAFSVVDRGRKINLILIHSERGQYVAMDRSCTHAGAQCTYNPKRRTMQCTSLNHAEYDLHGTLLHGRTHGNLRVYEIERLDSTLKIVVERAA